MDQNPLTDRAIGFKGDEWERFREVRHKALEDYVQRRSGGRKKGKPAVMKPQAYRLGEMVTLGYCGYRTIPKSFLLVEVVDFAISKNKYGEDDQLYYAIIRNASDKEFSRVGRLIHFWAKKAYYGEHWEPFNAQEVKWAA